MMKRRLLVLAIVLAGCVPAGGPPGLPGERLLAVIPEGCNVLVPVAFSRDGRVAAYAERSDGTDRLVVGGRRGPPQALV